MKNVPYYRNSPDNLHCLQASVKSVLAFNGIAFDENEVDQKTGYFGVPSWTPHAVNWFEENNLDVKLYSPFDYQRFLNEGEDYLKVFKGNFYFKEKAEGQYKFVNEVQQAVANMIRKNLWEKRNLSISDLRSKVNDAKTLAIGKTTDTRLKGKTANGVSHYVTIIKEYHAGKWQIHDPGLPGKEYRTVKQFLDNGQEVFPGDIIIISPK